MIFKYLETEITSERSAGDENLININETTGSKNNLAIRFINFVASKE